jgi:hypothetical protein
MDAQERIEALTKENQVLGVRLTLAQAFVRLLQVAYDALLYHGVNFRDLREYKNDQDLEVAAKLPITDGRNRIVAWMGRVESAILAAQRRKGIRKVVDNDPPRKP